MNYFSEFPQQLSRGQQVDSRCQNPPIIPIIDGVPTHHVHLEKLRIHANLQK